MLSPGQNVELSVEKPAAGGRMIARHEGQVVLVAGAIPGERVLARVERTERRLAFASVVDVHEESPDRRAAFADSSCGGCVYSHIAYPRQLGLKSDIVRDAFLRLGRIPIDVPIPVAPSPERGYRMRARFHVDGTRFGFYREGTHALCDAASTGQVSDTALESVSSAVTALVARWRAHRVGRVDRKRRWKRAGVGGRRRRRSDDRGTVRWRRWRLASGLVGCAIQDRRSRVAEAGAPSVTDALSLLTRGRVPDGRLRRHAASFFQANRFLVPDLLLAVMDAVVADGPVLDLYAGVGLFSVALAASGRPGVVAVEGDRMSGADLEWNARNVAAAEAAPTVILDSVERYLAARDVVFTARPDGHR